MAWSSDPLIGPDGDRGDDEPDPGEANVGVVIVVEGEERPIWGLRAGMVITETHYEEGEVGRMMTIKAERVQKRYRQKRPRLRDRLRSKLGLMPKKGDPRFTL